MDRCSMDKKSSTPSSTDHEEFLNQMRDSLLKASSINEEDKEKAVENDDKDIKVIGESSRSGYSANAVLKNAAVTKALSDLLLTNKPNIRELFQMFQSKFMNAFLAMWMDINKERLESNDVKSYQVIYGKLLEKLESSKARMNELSKENRELKIEYNQLLAGEDKKLALKNDIIKALEKTEFQQKQNLVKSLEEKLKTLQDSLQQSIEEGKILKMKLQHFECTKISFEKDLEAYKNLPTCKDLKDYVSVECQTDLTIEEKINQITNNSEVYDPMAKKIKRELIDEISNINGASSNAQVQEPMYIDLESECSVVSQTPLIQLSCQTGTSKQKSQSSLQNSNKKHKQDF